LSPSAHVNDIAARAHKRANMILRTFVSQDVSLLIRAYLVYVRPVVEHNTVVWSPYTINDIETIERYRDVLQRNCLDCVNSVMMKDCLVYVCIAWNYVYLLI